jgi:hypothetical protein
MKLKNCSVTEFIDRVKDKDVICFGAGLMPNDICNIYENCHFEKYVSHIADNDPQKWGENYILYNKSIKVISPEELKKLANSNIIIIITSYFFVEIIEQLSRFKELEDTYCYIYPIMHSIYPKL